MQAPTELLTVSEVADVLRVHFTTVYKLVRDKQLVAHRFGPKKGIRVSRAELDRFLADSLIEPDAVAV